LGITSGEYIAPDYLAQYSYNAPRWATSQTSPRPTGSVWQKINNVNLGTNLSVKKFDSTLGTFVQQNCPVYFNDAYANFALDPSSGGTNIVAGATYAQVDVLNNNTASFSIFEKFATGPTMWLLRHSPALVQHILPQSQAPLPLTLLRQSAQHRCLLLVHSLTAMVQLCLST
jgi:hypothetical protein